MKLRSILSLIIFLSPLFALAQGVVSGTMIDAGNSEPLLFANVLVKETGDGVSTDFDGKYQLDLPAGTYTLEFSYTGYQNKTIEEVIVKDGEVNYLDVALSEATEVLGEVVIVAKAVTNTEGALMVLQRKSDQIIDPISAKEMSRYGVSDAAGAMRKVTGVTVSGGKYVFVRGLGDRYSLTQLNGLVIPSSDPYRNAAQLDLIPSNLLENIITAKTFTPDKPGTFTGGLVDITTKSFPEQRTISISVSGGFNAQNNLSDDFLTYPGGDNDYWGYDDGTRERPSLLSDPEVEAILNTGTPLAARLNRDTNGDGEPDGERIGQLADDAIRAMNRDFTPDTTSMPIDHSFGITYGDRFNLLGNEFGIIANGSYKHQYINLPAYQIANWRLEDATSLIPEERIINQGDYDQTLSTENTRVSGLLGLAYRIGDATTITLNSVYNHNTDKGSRFIFGERPDNLTDPEFLVGRSLTWSERELTNFQLGGEHILRNINNAKIEWKVSQSASSLSEPDTRFFENRRNIDTGQEDFPESDIQRPFYFFRELSDDQQDFKLDITMPFDSTSGNKFKFGGLITQKERDFEEQRYEIQSNLAETAIFTGDPDVFLADDNVGIVSTTDRGSVNLANYLINRTLTKNSYAGTDEVSSAYGMVVYNVVPRLKFIGGVRFEQTNLFSESADTSLVDSLRTGRIEENDFLPSVNFVYQLIPDKMNLRASFSQTLARPNMREIAPFEAFDPLTKSIYFGNVNLERTLIQNFDLRWEYFMNPGEVFAVSAYYKNFNNPIVFSYRRAPNPEIEFVNVETAELFGVEFEFRKNLGEWIPALQNFKFNTNLSFISSTADVAVDEALRDVEPDSRPFAGQAPFILNAALIYSNIDNGIDATLALNSVGDRLAIIGREGTPDIYDRGRTQLDINIIKRFDNGLNVNISAKNLLDDRFLQSSVDEATDTEYIYFRYQRGISFGVGISYTIK